jgi:hypothetical protein
MIYLSNSNSDLGNLVIFVAMALVAAWFLSIATKKLRAKRYKPSEPM